MAHYIVTPQTIRFKLFSSKMIEPDIYSIEKFARLQKREIEARIERLGFSLELAKTEDIEEIKQLISEECSEQVSRQMAESDFYRCIVFGYFVLVKRRKEIISFQITMPYADRDRTAYGIFTLVKKQYKGNTLPVLVSRYASLMAMEDGQQVKRTWIAPNNYPSLKNGMNYCGYFCEGFSRELYMRGQPRILFKQHLTPEGIFNNLATDHELEFFLAKYKGHYLLIDPMDFDLLENALAEGKFTVCALTKRKHGNKPFLLAVANCLMNPA